MTPDSEDKEKKAYLKTRITTSQHKELKKAAVDLDKSMEEIFGELIDAWLVQRKNQEVGGLSSEEFLKILLSGRKPTNEELSAIAQTTGINKEQFIGLNNRIQPEKTSREKT